MQVLVRFVAKAIMSTIMMKRREAAELDCENYGAEIHKLVTMGAVLPTRRPSSPYHTIGIVRSGISHHHHP